MTLQAVEYEDSDISLESGTLRVRRWGAADAPAVVCVPGLSANLCGFDRLAERKAGRSTALSALPPGGHLAEGVLRPQIALKVGLGLDVDSLDRQVHPSEGGLLRLRHQQILLQPAGPPAGLVGSHHSTCAWNGETRLSRP